MSTTTRQDTERDETGTNEPNAESRASTESERNLASEPRTVSTRETPPEGSDLPRDVVFGLLSTERRRRLLRYLDEEGSQTTLGEVAEHVAAAENDVDVAHLSSDQRKRVYVGLYQCHLPKLDDAGVIEYDRERGTIELLGRADQLFPHLYLDPEEYVVLRSPRGVVRSTRLYDLWTRLVDRLGR